VQTVPEVLEVLRSIAAEQEELVIVGKTWTSDGFFRTTRNKLTQRVAEGCITVEMEAASLMAVAKRRNVQFGQYLYVGDNLASPEWDEHGWLDARGAERRVFELAANAAIRRGSVVD
jgi:uridine phosphorylase